MNSSLTFLLLISIWMSPLVTSSDWSPPLPVESSSPTESCANSYYNPDQSLDPFIDWTSDEIEDAKAKTQWAYQEVCSQSQLRREPAEPSVPPPAYSPVHSSSSTPLKPPPASSSASKPLVPAKRTMSGAEDNTRPLKREMDNTHLQTQLEDTASSWRRDSKDTASSSFAARSTPTPKTLAPKGSYSSSLSSSSYSSSESERSRPFQSSEDTGRSSVVGNIQFTIPGYELIYSKNFGELNKNRSPRIRRQIENKLPQEHCELCLNRLPANHALILDAGTKKLAYPSVLDYILVKNGAEIILDCGRNGSFKSNIFKGQKTLTLKCLDGLLKFKENQVPWSDYECAQLPKTTLLKVPNSRKYDLCQQYQVGFHLESGFETSYKLCIDENTVETKYTIHQLGNRIRGQEFFERTSGRQFIQSELPNLYRNVNIEEFYEQRSITKHLKTLLGGEQYAKLTKDLGSRDPIIRGQLIAKSDLVYRSEQQGTLYYATVRPMMMNLHLNNWTNVKHALINFASNRVNTLTVFSGIQGYLKHLDRTGSSSELSLGTRSGQLFQKIPEIFFKIAYDPNTRDCVAIILHNTTYDVIPGKECKDETARIPWLKDYVKEGRMNGVTYACSCSGRDPLARNFLPAYLPVDTVANLLLE